LPRELLPSKGGFFVARIRNPPRAGLPGFGQKGLRSGEGKTRSRRRAHQRDRPPRAASSTAQQISSRREKIWGCDDPWEFKRPRDYAGALALSAAKKTVISAGMGGHGGGDSSPWPDLEGGRGPRIGPVRKLRGMDGYSGSGSRIRNVGGRGRGARVEAGRAGGAPRQTRGDDVVGRMEEGGAGGFGPERGRLTRPRHPLCNPEILGHLPARSRGRGRRSTGSRGRFPPTTTRSRRRFGGGNLAWCGKRPRWAPGSRTAAFRAGKRGKAFRFFARLVARFFFSRPAAGHDLSFRHFPLWRGKPARHLGTSAPMISQASPTAVSELGPRLGASPLRGRRAKGPGAGGRPGMPDQWGHFLKKKAQAGGRGGGGRGGPNKGTGRIWFRRAGDDWNGRDGPREPRGMIIGGEAPIHTGGPSPNRRGERPAGTAPGKWAGKLAAATDQGGARSAGQFRRAFFRFFGKPACGRSEARENPPFVRGRRLGFWGQVLAASCAAGANQNPGAPALPPKRPGARGVRDPEDYRGGCLQSGTKGYDQWGTAKFGILADRRPP